MNDLIRVKNFGCIHKPLTMRIITKIGAPLKAPSFPMSFALLLTGYRTVAPPTVSVG